MKSLLLKRFGPVAVALVLIGVAAGPAKADIWNFSYSFAVTGGPNVTASGTITTSNTTNPDGSYTITGITGTRTFNGETDTITGLVPVVPGFSGNDNELFRNSPYLDFNGFSFYISSSTNGDSGTNMVNVYYNGGGPSSYTESYGGVVQYGPFNLSDPPAAPEPSTSIPTVIVGLMGLGYAWRRQRNAAG
jgi:hypothetical protein